MPADDLERQQNRRFAWRGWNEATKQEDSGTLFARDADLAARILRARNIIVADLHPVGGLQIGGLSFQRRIHPKILLPFWRKMAVELRAGIDAKAALERLSTARSNTRTANLAADIAQRLEEGETLGEAFRAHRREVGGLPVALLMAADRTGQHAAEFDRLAGIVERQTRTVRAVRKALMYPTMVMTVASVVFVMLLLFVVPTFKGIFAQFGGTLPAPTRLTLALASGIGKFWWALLLLLGGAVFGGLRVLRNPTIRRRIDLAILSVPKFGPFILEGEIARSLSVMVGLLTAGLTMVDVVLPNVAEVSGRRKVVGDGWRFVAEVMSEGKPMWEGMRLYNDSLPGGRVKVFPEMLVEIAESAESTSRFEELFGGYAQSLQEEVEHFTETISSLIEPLTMIVIGLVVGFIILSMYLPMFNYIKLVSPS